MHSFYRGTHACVFHPEDMQSHRLGLGMDPQSVMDNHVAGACGGSILHIY